jgi:hypothetical protein
MGSMFDPDVQDVTTRMEFPPWVEDAMRGNVDRGNELADRPYEPYQGDMFAGFNPMQERGFASADLYGQMGLAGLGNAFNLFGDSTGRDMMGGAYSGLMDFAGNGGPEAAQINRGDIREINPQTFLDYNVDDYMNPYTQNVIQNTTDEMERGRQNQMQQGAAAANAAGAFGGSRHGVTDSLSNAEFFRNQGNMANDMNRQAYDNATGLISKDISNDLFGQTSNANNDLNTATTNAQLQTQSNISGAQQELSALLGAGTIGSSYANNSLNAGDAFARFGQNGLAAQAGAGNQIQGFGQAQLDEMYRQFLEGRDWGANNFDHALAPLNGQLPSNQTQPYYGQSNAGNAAGFASIIEAMGGKDGFGWWGG